jgi:hypothetical protein
MADSATALQPPRSQRASSGFEARSQTVVAGLGVAVLAIGMGIAAATSVRLGEALIVVALVCLYVGYAAGHPRGAVIAMLASLALIPVYAVPTFRSFYPEPTAVAALIVVAVLVRPGSPIRFNVIDLAFAAACGALLLAVLLGPRSLNATLSELFLWVPPYMAGRAVCKRRDGPHTFALAVVIGGLIALPFIAYETVTHDNVFFKFARANSELTKLWAHPALRPGGLLRSEGAFGHPLSMAVIIGSCCIFAVGLALRAKTRGQQLAWILAAVALAIGQYTSHERSGWFVLIGGLLLFAVAVISRQGRARHVFTIAMVAIPLTLVAASLSEPSGTEQRAQRSESTSDRVALWRRALEPGALGLVGSPETATFNRFANAVKPGLVSIDSGYLQVADIYGTIALFALFAVVAAVGRVAFVLRGTWAAVFPAVALADLIALAVVGFQTQLPIFIWLVVGAVSGVDVRRRSLSKHRGQLEPASPLQPGVAYRPGTRDGPVLGLGVRVGSAQASHPGYE